MWGPETIVVVLLTAAVYQVDSLLPYQADSSGKCHKPKTEYTAMQDGESKWCCSRCPPGNWLKVACDGTADSVCEPCPNGQYMQQWNYRQQCSSCPECREYKGLQYLQNCTRSTKPRCECQPGMYCEFRDDGSCTECIKYYLCKLGFGVSMQGTADTNVRCSACPDGTFSDKISYTESCKPHTRCQTAVVERGTATSDTVCDSTTTTPTPVPTTTPQSPGTETRATVLLTPSLPVKTESPLTTTRSSDLMVVMRSNHPATKPTASAGVKLVVVVVPSVISCVLLLIIILVVLRHCGNINRKESHRPVPITDPNGNCEKADRMHHKYAVDAHEQTCLMETSPALSNSPEKPSAGMEAPRDVEHQCSTFCTPSTDTCAEFQV